MHGWHYISRYELPFESPSSFKPGLIEKRQAAGMIAGQSAPLKFLDFPLQYRITDLDARPL
jgi:hypothetical protein